MEYFGFWKEEGYLEMPSILDSINKEKLFDANFEKKLFKYFMYSCSLGYTFSPQYSIIDGSQIVGGDLISDGKWVWTQDFWHYYKENKVTFPEEFIQDVKKAYRYPYFIFFLKMLWLRYSDRKIARRLEGENSFPKASLDGKHFDFDQATTKYKTSLLFSIPKSSVKVKVALFELIALSRKELDLNLLLVVTEVIETEDEIQLKLNTLSLEASFFEKYLHQHFWLSRVYLDQNIDLENEEDKEIEKATLKEIEVLNLK